MSDNYDAAIIAAAKMGYQCATGQAEKQGVDCIPWDEMPEHVRDYWYQMMRLCINEYNREHKLANDARAPRFATGDRWSLIR